MRPVSSLFARTAKRLRSSPFAYTDDAAKVRSERGRNLALESLDERIAPATLGWALPFGGTSAERVVAVSAASDGSILSLVTFQGQTSVPTSTGTVNLTSFGSQDLLVIRQGSDGVISTVQQIGTSGYDQGAGLFQNPYDQVLVGWTAGAGPRGNSDWALATLDRSSLALLATDYMGGTGNDYLRSMNDDTNGDMAFGGSIENGFNANPDGSGTPQTLSAQAWAAAVVVLRYDRTFAVAGVIDGPNDQVINSVTLGGGYISVGGYLRGNSVDMDPSAGDQTVSIVGNSQKGFVELLDQATLVPSFVKIFGKDNAGGTEVLAVTTDALTRKTYATGSMGSDLDVNIDGSVDLVVQGNTDAFAIGYDLGGNNILAANLGGTGEDYGTSLAFDSPNNRLLVTGYYTGNVTVPGTPFAISSAGGKDGFVLQMKEGQGVTGLDHFGGGSDDTAWAVLPIGNDVWVGGQFVGTTDLAPSPETSPASSSGSADAFTFRWNNIVSNIPSPKVVSINRTTPLGPLTNANSVDYTVTFSKSVTGVDADDFNLALGGVTATTPVVVSGSGTTYTVTVNGIAGTGSLGLNLADDDSIADSTSFPLGGTGAGNGNFTGEVYNVDTDAPTVTINQKAGQADPTNAAPIAFTVHFNEPVTGFQAGDIDFTGSTAGTLLANVTGSGADYTVNVTGMSTSGNVIAAIVAGAAIDGAGNSSAASTSTDNSIAFDNVAPSVTIDKNVGQGDPTGVSPIVFHVVFSEPVTGFTAADVDLSTSTVSGTLIKSIGGSGADYTVSVTGMVGVGNVIATIAAGVAEDAAGNGNSAAANTDNIVAFNHVGSLQFTAAVFNTFEGEGNAAITVSRLDGGDGAISVSYTTTGGTATSDVDFTAQTDKLDWIANDSSPKTILVPIKVDSTNEWEESFTVTLSSPTNNAYLGAQTTATVVIAKSNGTKIEGAKPKPQSTFTDDDGDVATLKLTGKVGELTYYLTDGKGPIAEIDLAGTDSTKSMVSLAVKKAKGGGSNGRVGIGAIAGTGVKGLSLAKADLTGTGINLSTFTGSIKFGDLADGAGIVLAGASANPKAKTNITAGNIGDGTAITITGAPLGNLTAIRVGVGTIAAPSVGAINIKGKPKVGAVAAIAGDFKSNLTIDGTGLAAGVPALKSFKAAGAVSDSLMQVTGDVGSVTVGSFFNSRLFVGFSGADTGVGSFTPSTVGLFKVTGKTNAFAHSYVIADKFNTVMLASVDGANATNFGVLYQSQLKALSVKSPAFLFDPNGAAEQDMPGGKFYVKKV
jgi:Calx-beta domain/Bacterial Ig-like domain